MSPIFIPIKDDRDFFVATEHRVVEEKIEVKTQENFTGPDGKVIILESIKRPLIAGNGEIYIVAISTDITQRVKEKEKIRRQEKLFRLLSEKSGDIITLFDSNFNRIYISPAVEQILGFSPNELLHRNPIDMIHPEDVNTVRDRIGTVIFKKKKGLIIECRYIKKDGEYVWVESNLEPILNENGDLVNVQSSTRDITYRVNARKALANSEKKYKDLINFSKAFIFAHDLDGNILLANPSFCKMLGIPNKQLLKRNIREFISEQFKKDAGRYLPQFQNKSYVEGVFKTTDKNGEKHYMIYDSFLVEESGNKPYVVCNAQDITQRIITERKLKKAQKIAEESVKQSDAFLAIMSHEIRTPMHGILGIADLLSKTPLTKTQQENLSIIQQSAGNLLVIINDILDMTKIKEGKIDLEKTNFDLNEVIQTVYKVLKLKADEKGLLFQLNAIPLNHSLIGDPFRLNQVLQNLLNNAIKFTENGSVTLGCKVLEESTSAITLQFSVEDTGIGIAREHHEKIFDEFLQATSDTTRKFGGTGLGLSICRRLIDLQQGRIWFESEEGKGSCFNFILTFGKSNENIKADQDFEIDYTCLGSLHVLLAEDNKINKILAKTLLERWDFTVDVAINGQEAISLVEKNDYDIILMDVQMPVLDGPDATRIIRKSTNRKKANTPVIALTANALERQAEMYLANGMNDYLSKPFTEEGLFLKIAKQFSVNPRKRITKSGDNAQKIVGEKLKPDHKVCDLTFLESIALGDNDYIREILTLFLKIGLEEFDKIEAAIDSDEYAIIKSSAHKLKSGVAMVGAKELSALLNEMESRSASPDPDLEKLRQLFIGARKIYDRASLEIIEILSNL